MLGHRALKTNNVVGYKHGSAMQTLGYKFNKPAFNAQPFTNNSEEIHNNQYNQKSIYVPVGLHNNTKHKPHNSLEKH
jgi:hypothetical protein